MDRAGSPLPGGTPIRTFVDGVDYSNDPQVLNGIGSYVVLTSGNSKTNANVSDTPTVQEGANLGDPVIYAAGDFTAATDVFREVLTWSPGRVVTTNVSEGSRATSPQPLKIQGLVTRPARGGNQFALLCNPTSSPVALSDYYLELDRLGTYHGPTTALSGVVNATAKARRDLPSATWLTATGDALKLVYRNPGGAGASAGGLDIVVDRVEFNATLGGTLNWEPGNTIMGDAPAPGVGQILQRDGSCTDSNQPSDFSLAREPGIPANSNLTVTVTVPTPGQSVPAATAVTFSWTISDDIFATAQLRVWANVTIGNQVIPLLADQLGATSSTWTTPDVAVIGAVLHVDVADPFGAHAGALQTFNLTRQSSAAVVIAALIVVVLAAFVLFGFLRARRREKPPTHQPPTSPAPPWPPSPTLPTATTPGWAVAKKVCPRCHTPVNATDASCFFCGYEFPTETSPPEGY